ncbi:MAG TPA: KipI antagonist [Clostridium sp.]|nr:KipI antagonist [Clostridium sp.]
MSISVLKPGLLTTVQDSGRYGYQKSGIVVSGAMDIYDMKLANIAIGNDENEGVLEATMIGPSLKISKGELIAITGADISPTINKIKVPMGRPVYIKEDSILEFGQCKKGCRTYIAVCGGFDIKSVMGSISTYLRGKLGGLEGRALKKGDVLNVRPKSVTGENIIKKLVAGSKGIYDYSEFCAPHWYIRNYSDYSKSNSKYKVVRAFEDRQYKNFGGESTEKFWNSEFVIDSKSDRMGYRLKGPKIIMDEKIEMISGEVSFGTIQIPSDGNPIILLADRATAGGYPKIAHVCDYDIQKLVQIKPGESIKFEKIDIKEAEKLYIERLKEIEELKKSIELITY